MYRQGRCPSTPLDLENNIFNIYVWWHPRDRYLQGVAVPATVAGLGGVEVRTHTGTSLADVSKFMDVDSSLSVDRGSWESHHLNSDIHSRVAKQLQK